MHAQPALDREREQEKDGRIGDERQQLPGEVRKADVEEQGLLKQVHAKHERVPARRSLEERMHALHRQDGAGEEQHDAGDRDAGEKGGLLGLVQRAEQDADEGEDGRGEQHDDDCYAEAAEQGDVKEEPRDEEIDGRLDRDDHDRGEEGGDEERHVMRRGYLVAEV